GAVLDYVELLHRHHGGGEGDGLATAALSEQIIAVASGVVGPDNVFSGQIVDPDTPDIDDAPVFIDDRVLFGFNSVAIEPIFVPILDLGVLLLSQNPTATITVVSRTDAVGSESINQEVSEQRAQAVVDYWAGKGIAPERVIIDARGESDASEDDDDQTAALNRSVEFRIANLFPEG
ncbi:MAG: OmpA family protein, partial [Actinomycetota bacterium]